MKIDDHITELVAWLSEFVDFRGDTGWESICFVDFLDNRRHAGVAEGFIPEILAEKVAMSKLYPFRIEVRIVATIIWPILIIVTNSAYLAGVQEHAVDLEDSWVFVR